MSRIFRSFKGLLFGLAMLGVACFNISSAFAAVVTGCDTDVWAALQAKAEAQIAYDSAVTRELINKPDSVLELTCFSDAAGVSAKKGGSIYSGDFTTDLQTVMPVTGGGNFNCTEIGKLWNQITTQGVDTGAPYVTFDQLVNGPLPAGAGADFTTGWKAANAANVLGAGSNLQTAVNNLQKPPALDFSKCNSSTDVLNYALNGVAC